MAGADALVRIVADHRFLLMAVARLHRTVPVENETSGQPMTASWSRGRGAQAEREGTARP
jgi:hypothetical protein